MSGFLLRAIFSALCLLLFLGVTGAQAQENDSDGLLAVPGSPSPPVPGGAQLNINPMQLEKNAAPALSPVQKEKPAGKLDNLNIEGTPEEDEMWWMNDVLARLPRSIQDDLYIRSGNAQRYCEENYMLNNFYDCECYGIAMLKDLVLKGGESESIIMHAEDERFKGCVDTGKIAGFAYGRCQESLMLVQISDETLETTCQCAARGLAREYKKNPVANMDRADRIYNGLIMDCRQRALTGSVMNEIP